MRPRHALLLGLGCLVVVALGAGALFAAVLSGRHPGEDRGVPSEWLGDWKAFGGRFSSVTTRTGAAHCHWESTVFLELADEQGPHRFIRDPHVVLSDWTTRPFDGDVDLPADAVDTGYARPGVELWLTDVAAYLVAPDHVELWAASKDPARGPVCEQP